MPIDFQQIDRKIREIGAGARRRGEQLEQRRDRARELLAAHADRIETLRERVERAGQVDPNLRCAAPLDEPLSTRRPAPPLPQAATLIAVDGSQADPDRHAQAQFCLVNVGAVVLRLHSGRAPEVHTESELLYGDELETRYGSMTEGMVALRRDLRERSKLDELSGDLPGPVVSFTDGPIELWGARGGEDAAAYALALQSYLAVLSRLQARGVVTAGYVDKPSADLVVRLLEIAGAAPQQLEQLREHHPLRGVSDRWLFGEKGAPLLGPGERSAVFTIRSASERSYPGALAPHFFYLNAGTPGHPWPARVEIPRWVAEDAEKLDLLHAVLVDQCRVMGARPYPYLLHRAHEVALVRQDEKAYVEQMLVRELRLQGAELDEGSYKQSAKDRPGRQTY